MTVLIGASICLRILFRLMLAPYAHFLYLIEGLHPPESIQLAQFWSQGAAVLEQSRGVALAVMTVSLWMGWHIANAGSVQWRKYLAWAQWVSLGLAFATTPAALISYGVVRTWIPVSGIWDGPTLPDWLWELARNVLPCAVCWMVFLTAFWWRKEDESERLAASDANLLLSADDFRAQCHRRNLIRTLGEGGAHPGALILQFLYIPLSWVIFVASVVFHSQLRPAFEGELCIFMVQPDSEEYRMRRNGEIRIREDGAIYFDGTLVHDPKRQNWWPLHQAISRLRDAQWKLDTLRSPRVTLRVDAQVSHQSVIELLGKLYLEGIQVVNFEDSE